MFTVQWLARLTLAGRGSQCRGLTPCKVLIFLRLVVVCHLTCLYPLLSFSVYRHSDEEGGRPSWPMLWDLYPLHLLIKALRTRNIRVRRKRTNWCWSIVV